MPSIQKFSEFVNAFALSIYIISAGGSISFVFNSIRMPQLFETFPFMDMDVQRFFLDILYESGTALPTLSTNNSKLVIDLTLRQRHPRSLLRLAADVLRKNMIPNAWVGLKRLPLPPGFDKEYIIFNARRISLFMDD